MDTRAEFGTAKATVAVRVSITSNAPLALVSFPVITLITEFSALVPVLSISGHSISAVAPDNSFHKEVSVQAIAA